MSDNLPRPQTPEEKFAAEWTRLGEDLRNAMDGFGEAMQKLANDFREATGGPKFVKSERLNKEES